MCCGSGGTGFITSYQCAAQCGPTAVPVTCSSTGDCTGGQVCCVTTAGGPGGFPRVTDATCAPNCTGTGKYTLCGSAADCPQSNPTCSPALLLPGLQYCQ